MGKKLQNSLKLVEKNKIYDIETAIELAKKVSFENFDPSIEVSFNLNLDVKHSDQQLRGSVVLPHGTGKTAKVLVVGDEEEQKIAKKTAADYVYGIEIMEKIASENWFDFDFVVTTPKNMAKFAKYGKLLGPKGLMPNIKLGTVTDDIVKTVENIKKGQLEYRTNDNGLINLAIGKKTFSTSDLVENYKTVYETIKSKRPAAVKGEFVIGITVSTTMGPGIKVEK